MKQIVQTLLFLLVFGIAVVQQRGREQSAFGIPTFVQHTHVESASEGASDLQPLSECFSCVVYLHPMIVSLVSSLIFRASPATVSDLVVPVVVDSIERHSFRTSAHVSQEILEYKPSLAYLDPSRTVVPVILVIGIAAPRKHGGPSSVFWGLSAVAPFSVAQVDLRPMPTSVIDAIAATRFGEAAQELRAGNLSLNSTIAATHPQHLFSDAVLCNTEHQPTTEAFSGKV